MQQEKYIFHLYVFSTCFGRDITHHQELQNYTNSDMVIVPREVRRDVVEEIKCCLARQYYARVRDVKRDERSLVSRCIRNSSTTSLRTSLGTITISEFVQFCNSWWWVISRPKHVENTYKWNIYLSCCIKLVFFNYPWGWSKTETFRSDNYVYFYVNLNFSKFNKKCICWWVNNL